jgi:putative membrane protein
MFNFGHLGRFGHMGYNSLWGGGSFMMFFWFIILAAVIYFIFNKDNKKRYYQERNQRDSYQNHQIAEAGTDQAEEIARERYAKGEISKEEFEEIISNLKK